MADGVSRSDLRTSTCMALRSIPLVGATVGADDGFVPFAVTAAPTSVVLVASTEPFAFVVRASVLVDATLLDVKGTVGARPTDGTVGAIGAIGERTAVDFCGADVGLVGVVSVSGANSVGTAWLSAAIGGCSIASESSTTTPPASAGSGLGRLGTVVGGASMTSPRTSTLGVERSNTFGKITSSTASATRSKIPSRRRRSVRSCDDLKPLTHEAWHSFSIL
jgi:hypothetical protein